MVDAPPGAALARAADRVRDLARAYEPPDYAEVPHPDAALFLCAIDHGTGYGGCYRVDGEGPFHGSALMWALGLAAERRLPGTLSAVRLAEVDSEHVAGLFEVQGETVSGPGKRAELWRELAAGLTHGYGGGAAALLDSASGRLGGPDGLLARLAGFEAYGDPLRKKSFLLAKIAERRGWLRVSDPERWEVCADSVLMRLALRAGLVDPAPVEELREATRTAMRRLADEAGVPPPLLDDLLWERGREDADLLGAPCGRLAEPPRPAGSTWY